MLTPPNDVWCVCVSCAFCRLVVYCLLRVACSASVLPSLTRAPLSPHPNTRPKKPSRTHTLTPTFGRRVLLQAMCWPLHILTAHVHFAAGRRGSGGAAPAPAASQRRPAVASGAQTQLTPQRTGAGAAIRLGRSVGRRPHTASAGRHASDVGKAKRAAAHPTPIRYCSPRSIEPQRTASMAHG